MYIGKNQFSLNFTVFTVKLVWKVVLACPGSEFSEEKTWWKHRTSQQRKITELKTNKINVFFSFWSFFFQFGQKREKKKKVFSEKFLSFGFIKILNLFNLYNYWARNFSIYSQLKILRAKDSGLVLSFFVWFWDFLFEGSQPVHSMMARGNSKIVFQKMLMPYPNFWRRLKLNTFFSYCKVLSLFYYNFMGKNFHSEKWIIVP